MCMKNETTTLTNGGSETNHFVKVYKILKLYCHKLSLVDVLSCKCFLKLTVSTLK